MMTSRIYRQPVNTAKVVPSHSHSIVCTSNKDRYDGWHENSLSTTPTETLLVHTTSRTYDSLLEASNQQTGGFLESKQANPWPWALSTTEQFQNLEATSGGSFNSDLLLQHSVEEKSKKFSFIHSIQSFTNQAPFYNPGDPLQTPSTTSESPYPYQKPFLIKPTPSNPNMAMLFPWTHYFANHKPYEPYNSTTSTFNPEILNEISQDELSIFNYTNISTIPNEDVGSGESADFEFPPYDWSSLEVNFIMHGILMPLIAIFGVFANFASLVVLTRRHMKSAVVNTYLAALSAFDGFLLLIALLLYPPMSYCEWYGSEPTSNWCRYFFVSSLITYPLSLIAQTGSVWILTALTVDRFIAIIWPLASRKWCTHRRALCVSLCILACSILYNIPAFFELRLITSTPDIHQSIIDNDRLIDQPVTLLDRTELRKNAQYVLYYKGYCYLIFMLLLPAGIMIVLNAYMIISIKKASIRRRSMNVSSNAVRDDKERRCTLMAVLVVSTFLTFNLLAFMNNMLEGFQTEAVLSSDFLRLVCIGNVLVALNSATNFIIYYLLGLRFRQMFCKLFCPCFYTPEMEYHYLSMYYGSGRHQCWTNGNVHIREMAVLGTGADPASTSLLAGNGGIISMKTVSTNKTTQMARTVNGKPNVRQSLRSNISAPSTTGRRSIDRNQRNLASPTSIGSRISAPVDASRMRAYQQRANTNVQQRN